MKILKNLTRSSKWEKKFQEPHQYQKLSSEKHNLFGRGNKLPATNNRKSRKIISHSLVGKWFLCTAVQMNFFKNNISVFQLTDEDTPVPHQVNWLKMNYCTDSKLLVGINHLLTKTCK